MANITTDADGRLTRIPDGFMHAADRGIIVRNTDQYSFKRTTSGLYLPGNDDDVMEKKYRLGEVTQIGNNVNPHEVDVGDILVYLTSTAYRMPNAAMAPSMWKIQHVDMSTMGVLPNLDITKRAPRWFAPNFRIVFKGANGFDVQKILDLDDKAQLKILKTSHSAKPITIITGEITFSGVALGRRARLFLECANILVQGGFKAFTLIQEPDELEAGLAPYIEQWKSGQEA